MKKRANISAAIIILLLSFLAFCAFAIDTGYVVTTRYKTQKLTETIALYMVSYLKSSEDRTEETLAPIRENFERLYSSLEGQYKFSITDVVIKDEENLKIKVETKTIIPTIFLKFAGIGAINVLQNSYAISDEKIVPPSSTTANSYLYKIPDLITDKPGYDLKIKYDKKYFVFAGMEDFENKIHWADIGALSDSDTPPTAHSAGTYEIYIVEDGERRFDFSPLSELLNILKFITKSPQPKKKSLQAGRKLHQKKNPKRNLTPKSLTRKRVSPLKPQGHLWLQF